jgi:serine/threonine-protein kinase
MIAGSPSSSSIPSLAAVLGAERFLAEIRVTARLDHPHILTLIDSGVVEGASRLSPVASRLLYYVLPYVRGESLRALLERDRQLPVALAITRQVAGALDHAHRHGVIHRDSKPENILLHEGEAMLVDFGIALGVTEAGGDRLTETGKALGTPQYMSPEQATGQRSLGQRSDIYCHRRHNHLFHDGRSPERCVRCRTREGTVTTDRWWPEPRFSFTFPTFRRSTHPRERRC